MGETVGFVDRTQNLNYLAKLVAQPRQPLGPFVSVRAAQQAVEGSVGRALRWTRTVEAPAGETYRGDDPSWWPPDLGAALVGFWWAQRGVVLVDQTSLLVQRWNSLESVAGRSASAPAAANQPAWVKYGPNARPTLRFVPLGTDRLVSNFSTLAPPFTVAIAAQRGAGTGSDQVAFDSNTFRIFVERTTATWRILSNTTTITGPVHSSGVDVLLATVSASPALTTGYFNGTSFGTTVDIPGGAIGAISFSRTGQEWSGDIPMCVVVDRVLTEKDRTQLVNYMRRQYQSDFQ